MKSQTAYPDTYKITKEFARSNRKGYTDAENLLWQEIRGKSLGAKFRRQHIIGDYIADFICLEKNLIIEVDGGYHHSDNQQAEDQLRSDWLYKQGYYVLRFTNEQVFGDIHFVTNRIKEIINHIN